MPFGANIIRVMIASPGDVIEERETAQRVIHGWNATNGHERRTVLVPVAWETHAAPAMGARAQEIINRQLVRDSDLLVAMFWTRIGTPTGHSPSGSVEEVEEHIRAGKPVMLYFSAAPVRPDSVDENQFRALQEFKRSCRERGLVEEYESTAQFREKFARQLAQTIIEHFSGAAVDASLGASTHGATGPPTDSGVDEMAGTRAKLVRPLTVEERDLLASLPDEARELLAAAGVDQNGTLLMTQTMGGFSVETNGRDFVEQRNPRSEARWRRAVRTLLELGLIEQRDTDGQVFSVTAEGFRATDLLSRLTERGAV